MGTNSFELEMVDGQCNEWVTMLYLDCRLRILMDWIHTCWKNSCMNKTWKFSKVSLLIETSKKVQNKRNTKEEY